MEFFDNRSGSADGTTKGSDALYGQCIKPVCSVLKAWKEDFTGAKSGLLQNYERSLQKCPGFTYRKNYLCIALVIMRILSTKEFIFIPLHKVNVSVNFPPFCALLLH